MSSHLAAVALSKGQPFEVQARTTPKPGPGELLIAVKSIALNPADGIIRSTGLFIPSYPTVIGFDLAGLVIDIGKNVSSEAIDTDGAPLFQPGSTRVAAYAGFFWTSCNPDYGAFQEKVLIPWQHAFAIPDEVSWNAAATLPVAVQVPLSAWDAMSIPRLSASDIQETQRKEEALLVWGASSSVGTMGVQSARRLKEDPSSTIGAVYATAGSANHAYMASLGADRVFDYKDTDVVKAITAAAEKDGLVIRHCFLAMGELESCQAVLAAFARGHEGKATARAKIASAPPIPANAEEVPGIEVMFVQPSSDAQQRMSQFRYWMGTWLQENLSKGRIEPSPAPKIVGRGLEAINTGIDILQKGVSCTKLVVEVNE